MKNKKARPINRWMMACLALVFVASLIGAAVQPAAAATTGKVAIVAVQKGKSVTIHATGLLGINMYEVRIGRVGSQAVDGVLVATVKTALDGSISGTFDIPSQFRALPKIGIRADGPNPTDPAAFGWFNNISKGEKTDGTPKPGKEVGGNQDGGTTTGGAQAPAGIPTGGAVATGKVKILKVEENEIVHFRLTGAPSKTKLALFLDWTSSSGAIQSVQVGTAKTTTGGNLDRWVRLPAATRNQRELRVRLQGMLGVNFQASAWFFNASGETSSGSSASAGTVGGAPYIEIVDVNDGESVKIKAYNFANGEYEVLIGKHGTKGRNGFKVDTISIHQDTNFTGTFDFPEDLVEAEKLSIRVQSADNNSNYAYASFENDYDSDDEDE